MANIQIKAKDNENIEKKPKVFFTCYQDDFIKYFDRICKDIFATHNCAIYYTADMNEEFEDMETDFARYNLFVVPVTQNLLAKHNRTMEKDIPYAKEKGIPVLPIMMEHGIDELYSEADKFGDMQYLDPNEIDDTALKYSDKLQRYLESVLISEEMAERVRHAFDAYIFLSYRKKDRKYANELMRIIHSNPECRDIAIWFDEFLTPGESFKENINKILSDSKMFTLLVTPNLLEEPDGKPNFVMGQEYPAALEAGVEIIPAEMEKTDKQALNEKFNKLPACIDPRDDEAFKKRLSDSVKRFAFTLNDTPEHNFLIGLAYLDGIDVEIDRQRGIELITSAAEKGLFEAMQKLYRYYLNTKHGDRDLQKAKVWAEKIADHYKEKYGYEDLRTENAMLNYARLCGTEKAEKQHIIQTVYEQRLNRLGKEDKNTVMAYKELITCQLFQAKYNYLPQEEDYIMCRTFEDAYELVSKVFGKENPVTIGFLTVLAIAQRRVDRTKALKTKTKQYELYCKALGEEAPNTLDALFKLADFYTEPSERLIKLEEAYLKEKQILGEDHPQVLSHLLRLAHMLGMWDQHEKAIMYFEELYKRRLTIYGKDHSSTQHALKFIEKNKERLIKKQNK